MTGRLEPSEAGRWFVYAELERDGRRVESWLPITVGEGPTAVGEDRRFAYHPPQRESGVLKLLGGVALYAMMAALLVAAIRLTSTRPVATRDPGRS